MKGAVVTLNPGIYAFKNGPLYTGHSLDQKDGLVRAHGPENPFGFLAPRLRWTLILHFRARCATC